MRRQLSPVDTRPVGERCFLTSAGRLNDDRYQIAAALADLSAVLAIRSLATGNQSSKQFKELARRNRFA